ncbi:MAG: hypothetical protein LC135_02895 [Phycisphaerae bacterium]|jgi:hypothetical protein|nr:hypothetical protein [Phycisphaerae bacterium]MCZ2398802.1 hypothetical protein [Phycisphaerae bacterium]
MLPQSLFALGPKGDGVEVVPESARDFDVHVCPGCKRLARHVREQGFDIVVERTPPYGALGWAETPRDTITLISRAFADYLFRSFTHDIRLGRVMLANGRPLEDWATCIGRTPTLLRGGHMSVYKPCDQCGTRCYHPRNELYVLRQSLPEYDITEEGYWGGLLVRERVLAQIDRKKWKGLKIDPRPVRERPEDNVGDISADWYYAGGAVP